MKTGTRKKRKHYQSHKYQKYYVTGSEAVKIYENTTEPVRHVNKPQRRVKQNNFRIILSVSIVFVCAISVMYTVSNRLENELSIKSLNKELQELKDNNATLKSKISGKMDLKMIEEKAINELGMIKPQDFQIKEIYVPKVSNTTTYEYDWIEEETSEPSFFDFINIFG